MIPPTNLNDKEVNAVEIFICHVILLIVTLNKVIFSIQD